MGLEQEVAGEIEGLGTPGLGALGASGPAPRAAAPTELRLPAPQLGGLFQLVRAVGEGSGRVYEARHSRVRGRFAVKMFANVDPSVFRRDAALAARLRHPNVVRVVDFGVAHGHGFAAMPYVDAHALATLLADGERMPVLMVARVISSVAEALASAHRVGLVHGHLRPEHIFVLPVEQSSSRVDDAGVTTRTTGFCLKGDLSGLPELTELTPYTAPEDANGQPEARSDQFALAAIVYHMLTGRPPFADDAERGEPPSLRDTVPALNVIVDEVVRKALAAEPEQRWPDVVTFAQSFQRAAEDLSPSEQTRLTPRSRVSTDVGLGTRAPATIETSSDTQKTVFPAPTSTRKGLWVGVAALLCLGTAAVGLALRFSASAPSRPTSQLPHAPEPPAGRIEIVQLPSLEPPAPSDVPIAPAHAAEHVKRARGAAVSETAAPSAAASNGALAAPVEAAAPRKPAVPQPLPPDLAAEEALLAAPRP